MATEETRRTWLSWEMAAVICRWVLGGFFIYMGLNKALNPVAFLKLVRQYEMVTDPVLLNSIAAALPWFEVFCGLLLMLGVAVRGSALMLAVMLAPFTVIVFRRALAMAAASGMPFHTIKFDCGCGTGEVIIWHKLIENCIFFLLACWLMTNRGRRFCTRFTFFPERAHREAASAESLELPTRG
jgi:uncharacterized membrane protein YphA (DoxX/SURF4 family)